LIASAETLLSASAVDRMQDKVRTDYNRELFAQGIGNAVSGFLGALPMTGVIVRSSANVQAGGRTRLASFLHGALLLVSIVAIPGLMNRIPLAALAAVLLHIGYKLAPWQTFVKMYRQGLDQFLPFVITIMAIVLTDLLTGVAIGMAAGVFFILRANAKTPFFMHTRDDPPPGDVRPRIRIRLSENVSFLNKAGVSSALHELPDGAVVVIDASLARWIDRDVLEHIHEFAGTAHHRGIDVELVDMPGVDAQAEDIERRKPNVTVGAAELRQARTGPHGV